MKLHRTGNFKHVFLLAVLNNHCFTHEVLCHWVDADKGNLVESNV
jgi:hypothetical protein